MPSLPALNVDFRPRAPALSARPSSGVAVVHLTRRRLETRVLSQRPGARNAGARLRKETPRSVRPAAVLQLSDQLSESGPIGADMCVSGVSTQLVCQTVQFDGHLVLI